MTFEVPTYREQFFVEMVMGDVPQSESIGQALKSHYGDTLIQIHNIEPSGYTWKVQLTSSNRGSLFGNAECKDNGVGFLLLGLLCSKAFSQ